MKAPAGADVGLYYDGPQLRVGDFLRTPTLRVYEVLTIRVQVRGAHVGRQHLRALVRSEVPWDEVAKDGGKAVFPLHWYPRGRERRRRA